MKLQYVGHCGTRDMIDIEQIDEVLEGARFPGSESFGTAEAGKPRIYLSK